MRLKHDVFRRSPSSPATLSATTWPKGRHGQYRTGNPSRNPRAKRDAHTRTLMDGDESDRDEEKDQRRLRRAHGIRYAEQAAGFLVPARVAAKIYSSLRRIDGSADLWVSDCCLCTVGVLVDVDVWMFRFSEGSRRELRLRSPRTRRIELRHRWSHVVLNRSKATTNLAGRGY